MNPQVTYVKTIVYELINSMPTSAIQEQYQQHKDKAELHSIALAAELTRPKPTHMIGFKYPPKRKYRSANVKSYLRRPAATIKAFTSDILPSVILLKLADSTMSSMVKELTHNDLAYILNLKLQEVVDIESSVTRVLNRPKNRHIIRTLLSPHGSAVTSDF